MVSVLIKPGYLGNASVAKKKCFEKKNLTARELFLHIVGKSDFDSGILVFGVFFLIFSIFPNFARKNHGIQDPEIPLFTRAFKPVSGSV